MRLIIALLSSVFFITTCALADTVVGLPADPSGDNCFPFGCAYNAEYQQVYTGSAFWPDNHNRFGIFQYHVQQWRHQPALGHVYDRPFHNHR